MLLTYQKNIEKICDKYSKSGYNQYYYHRRFLARKVNTKNSLIEQITQGDLDHSDYYNQSKYELFLLNEHLKVSKSHQHKDEIKVSHMRRFRKIIDDYEKDEYSLINKITNLFAKEFKLLGPTQQFRESLILKFMSTFDGTLEEMYNFFFSFHKQLIK